MTESTEGASALGAAQKGVFWGYETDPRSVRDSSIKMFNTVSELLRNKAAPISTSEAKINTALSSFTRMEHENKAQTKKIDQALDHIVKSDAAVALKASIGQFSKVFGVSVASNAAGALMGFLSGKPFINGGLSYTSSDGFSGGTTSQALTQSAQLTV